MSLKILIIEDERLTARDLASTIQSINDHVQILPFLHSFDEAAYFFKQAYEVDLIFSDIDLGDGLSIDLFKLYPPASPIIFCTAYDQYMLNAFKLFGIDYVLKPFKRIDIENALLKYYEIKKHFSAKQENLEHAVQFLQRPESILEKSLIIQRGEKIMPIQLKDIAYFVVENESVVIYSFSKEKFYTNETLEKLEKLCAHHFHRVNRQFLVNRKAILSASRHFNRKLTLNLSVPYKENVLVGKLKITDFLKWLESAQL